jgi:non-canonical purine NTP pyrophosphatase (RdgB/HAM1 family)
MQIRFATGNARKLGEARLGCAPFGITIQPFNVTFQEIQASDPIAIALHKSQQAFDQVGGPVVVADTFWAIPALNGFPGAYMKEVTRWFRPEDFINLLRPYADRQICLYETVVYRDAERERVFAGEYQGEIVQEPRGEGLPIEQVAAFNGQTIAERMEQGYFSHDPEDFIWSEFAEWYAGLRGTI